MFVEAIEKAAKYTKAIHSIGRNYGSAVIQPGKATLFFVNSDGWALTCGHVADQFAIAKALQRKTRDFTNELLARRGGIKQNFTATCALRAKSELFFEAVKDFLWGKIGCAEPVGT
jgi:hypothetical protein